MRNKDRIKCLEFICEGKFESSKNLVLEILDEFNELDSEGYTVIKACKDYVNKYSAVEFSYCDIKVLQAITSVLEDWF
jgi:hypothetical protein